MYVISFLIFRRKIRKNYFFLLFDLKLKTANSGGSLLPSPRYGNGPNGRNNGQNGSNPRPRSLIMQKVDNDSSSRRNSEVPPLSRRNSTMSQYENRVEQEKNQTIDKIDKTAQDRSNKMARHCFGRFRTLFA